MTYQMAATAVTLNDLPCHLRVACLFKCNPSNIYAALHEFNWQCARGPSTLAELPVWIGRLQTRVYSRNTESG